MSRNTDLAVNFLLNGALFYLLGRWLRGHRLGLGLGVVLGLVSAAVTLAVDGDADADVPATG